MCWDWLARFFGSNPEYSIPHPEEPYDPDATKYTVSIGLVFQEWYDTYQVPIPNRSFWSTQIIIKIDPDFPYPAGAWFENGKRHATFQPGYFNKGVVAHEQAHNSYALLTEEQKGSFSSAYHALMEQDNKQLEALFICNPYGLTNDVEAHAEIYRYLGQQMPKILKQYYPKLF